MIMVFICFDLHSANGLQQLAMIELYLYLTGDFVWFGGVACVK